MAKKQDAKLFLEVASANQDNRPVLCFVNKTENFSVSTDGYRAHYVLVDLPEYQLGLNHTKYSTKKGMVLDGRFPDMEVIKKRPKILKEIVLDKDAIAELIKATKIALVFAKYSANSIRITMLSERMTVCGKSSERGDAETTIDLKGQNIALDISLNGRYLLDTLKGFSHDSVTIYAIENEPIHFESSERYAVIMPMSR